MASKSGRSSSRSNASARGTAARITGNKKIMAIAVLLTIGMAVAGLIAARRHPSSSFWKR